MLYLVYAVVGVCYTWCMLYSVYAVLGVCCTRCQLMTMAWRDSEGWLNFVFFDDGWVVDGKVRGDEDEDDVEDTSGYGKSGVRLAWFGWGDLVSVPLLTGSGLVPAVSRMVNWLAHEILYVPVSPDDLPHLLSSLSFSSWTLPSPKNTKLSHPSLSLHAMIMSQHRVQHTLSTAYTEYSIHRVQHTPSTAYTEYSLRRVLHHPMIDCLCLPASLSALSGPWCTQFSTFPELWVNQ